MTATLIRKKLHNFIDSIEEKKAKAIYTLFESEIENEPLEYSSTLKNELDNRYEYYQNGGKMITANEANKKISKILNANKAK